MVAPRVFAICGSVALVSGGCYLIWSGLGGVPEEGGRGVVRNAGASSMAASPSNKSLPPVIDVSSIAQPAPQEASSAAGRDAAPKLKVRGQLDWSRYPGTLQDQVEKALSNRDGKMAADLAAKLKTCDRNARMLEVAGSQGGESGSTPSLQAIRNERLQEYQRQIAICQSVVGDQKQVRMRLLDVAVEQKFVGAANQLFNLGVRRPDVLQQVVRDAQEGDLASISDVAAYNTSVFGIDKDTQDAVRYSLQAASSDPIYGPGIGRDLSSVAEAAVPLAGEKQPVFDFSKISDVARRDGAVIGHKLIQRLKNADSN